MVKRGSTRLDYVFSGGRYEKYRSALDMIEPIICRENMGEHREALRSVEVIACTWDMESLTEQELEEFFPSLKLVLYAAGSVKYFAEPFLNRGVRIVSAWGAMSIPVAEFTVSQILLANKGYYLAMQRYRDGDNRGGKHIAANIMPGNYDGVKVGILGAGMIGARVIRMLKAYDVEVLVYDPFMSEAKAAGLGVKNVSIEEVFSTCQTISCHIANVPETVGMLDYRLFSMMKDNAAFINTGRGAQVVEPDLARALSEKPYRCAILDVTHPEPSPRDHPFWQLPNLFMTPHIAGSAVVEVYRMPDWLLDELELYKAGKPLNYEVFFSMLPTMA